MKHAYIFPGQGAQFSGMGKSIYESSARAKRIMEEADEVLGFKISEIMFHGSEEDLKKTNITQPAVFIHSIAAFYSLKDARPEMVAGHSLGEFSALVANETLSFPETLKLVNIRAGAMQKACAAQPSAMAAILGLADSIVEDICKDVSDQDNEIVVAANYNCPGQLVISGTIHGIQLACEKLKAAGAKRALVLPVGGAFHSPLMMPAKEELMEAINASRFSNPICPIYQNVTAKATSEPDLIKLNLISQLTGPVRWTQCVEAMIANGAGKFTECGPGKVLQGLVQKINRETEVEGIH